MSVLPQPDSQGVGFVSCGGAGHKESQLVRLLWLVFVTWVLCWGILSRGVDCCPLVLNFRCTFVVVSVLFFHLSLAQILEHSLTLEHTDLSGSRLTLPVVHSKSDKMKRFNVISLITL